MNFFSKIQKYFHNAFILSAPLDKTDADISLKFYHFFVKEGKLEYEACTYSSFQHKGEIKSLGYIQMNHLDFEKYCRDFIRKELHKLPESCVLLSLDFFGELQKEFTTKGNEIFLLTLQSSDPIYISTEPKSWF